ncbi:MAG TPA: hypothetical protein VJ997_05675 [Longimicrobiales bacterium]|nr:hypothetical protein [Longimicrobiales bacterium]
MKRSTLVPALVATALLGFAPAAKAQLRPGVHLAQAADVFGGSLGAGASLQVSFPLFPMDVFVAGEYFFPDCGTADGCGYLGGSADLHFRLPVPVLTPYATGGIVYRRFDAGDGSDAVANTGFGLGAGVNLGTLVLGAYAEARYEFVDPDDQLVFRVGIRF